MNEIDFKNWLHSENINSKVQSDVISRLKRIERDLNSIDIDDEYKKDCCCFLLSCFNNKGINQAMSTFESTALPIGKYSLSTYKYSLTLYLRYLQSKIE